MWHAKFNHDGKVFRLFTVITVIKSNTVWPIAQARILKKCLSPFLTPYFSEYHSIKLNTTTHTNSHRRISTRFKIKTSYRTRGAVQSAAGNPAEGQIKTKAASIISQLYQIHIQVKPRFALFQRKTVAHRTHIYKYTWSYTAPMFTSLCNWLTCENPQVPIALRRCLTTVVPLGNLLRSAVPFINFFHIITQPYPHGKSFFDV